MDPLDRQLKRLEAVTEELASLCSEIRDPTARDLISRASFRLGVAGCRLVAQYRRSRLKQLKLVS